MCTSGCGSGWRTRGPRRRRCRHSRGQVKSGEYSPLSLFVFRVVRGRSLVNIPTSPWVRHQFRAGCGVHNRKPRMRPSSSFPIARPSILLPPHALERLGLCSRAFDPDSRGSLAVAAVTAQRPPSLLGDHPGRRHPVGQLPLRSFCSTEPYFYQVNVCG
ncbi:uncharacterized protein B0H18DRAFT_354787 [Fomitopsis serialis]|uniref:uncharacterized protein n=1 Tax=Fomitopsis serialis TaxID=139415 RepID=UPI0020080F14|nr:uncharacterized protein B0H18DRAFT_354787 [Neoantrodia serialis]KAH9911548.1 hypothetical protein B0H18DRAFT_354787 [Neoantrodia serialis]